jgi:hypothetical protein
MRRTKRGDDGRTHTSTQTDEYEYKYNNSKCNCQQQRQRSLGIQPGHDRWMVQPWLPLSTEPDQPPLTSSSEPEFEPEATSSSRNNGSDDNVNIDSGDYDGYAPSAILKSLFNERLLGSIEVTCIERGEIVLNLSDSLALSIALQPIPTTRPTVDLTSVERRSRRSPDGLPLPSRRTTTKTAGDSLHFILSQGLSKAQQSLLDHWRSHKAAAIASKILTTIAPPTTTVFTSGSATTAVTATARGPPSKLDDNLPE